jgi:hypothetical protein
MLELDAIGVRHGTWLSSIGRGCLVQWEPFLAPLRQEPFDLLEIGVGAGASLRTWRDWFPRARLVGIDARRIRLSSPIADCEVVQGNQTESTSFHQLLRDYRFRVIVADGSRHDDDQVRTFMMLFPWLEPASIYCCVGFDADEMPARYDAGAWFADVALALNARQDQERLLRDQPELNALMPRMRGVYLGRGGVVIVSA